MHITPEQFGKAVVSVGILSADSIQSLWKAIPASERPKDGAAFAALLVKTARLTPFQADEILAGRESSLVFGDYLLVDKLGAGGMGEVFKARHRHMKRIVALKVVSQQSMKDEAAVKRFQREVEAAARLEHPNVVTAFDSRFDRGIHYLVMQYVEGNDLYSLVKQQGPLPVDLAIQCILQAACGLAYAHGEGIVHRDIKPANLLLDKKGTIKILDMGLARLDDTSADNLTGTEQVMGTVDYMSPEQAACTHTVDARTDMYSLGCTLWFLLTGRKLFEGETLMSRMLKHREAPAPSLCAARDDVPYALEMIYQQMVAKLPQDRYRSIDDVVRELESLQANTSGLRRLAASGDSALNVFSELDKEQRTSVREGTRTRPVTSSPGGDAATVDFRDGGVGTDPKSEISVPPLPKVGGRKRKKPPIKLIGLGAAGFLFVLLGVIIIIRNQHGDEVGRMELAPGLTAEVQHTGISKTATKRIPPPPAIAPFDYEKAKVHQVTWAKYLGAPVEQKNSIGMTLALIPPGEFMMGSTPEQVKGAHELATSLNMDSKNPDIIKLASELRQHHVVISAPYFVGMTEITVGQFKAFVHSANYKTKAETDGGSYVRTDREANKGIWDSNITWKAPGYPIADDSAVASVAWDDCVEFCNWLSGHEELIPCYRKAANGTWNLLPASDGYRLLTEAEWEYACRAGTVTQFSFGDDASKFSIYGISSRNATGVPISVASKVPNNFGLFDMHGNVMEWCQDWYSGEYSSRAVITDPSGPPNGSQKAVRGGSWFLTIVGRRSTARTGYPPTMRANFFGFRVARAVAASSLSPGPARKSVAGMRASSNISTSADRVAAEWILSVGGKVRVLVTAAGGSQVEKEVTAATDLPKGDVRLSSIRLNETSGIQSDDYNRFQGLKHLRSVGLKRVPLTADILAFLQGSPDIAYLDLWPTAGHAVFSDSDVERIAKWKKLAMLGIRYTSLTDKAASTFASMPKLTALTIFECKITNEGLRKLLSLPRIMRLSVEGAPIDDGATDTLPEHSRLTDLGLGATRITDLSLARISALPKLQYLSIYSTRCADEGLRSIGGLKSLQHLNLSNNRQITDAGLRGLESLLSLRKLTVTGTGVTQGGVAALQKALPNCEIVWDDPAKPKARSPEPNSGLPEL